MCLAIPGKIVSIDKSNPELKMAKVTFSGVSREVCIQWLDDVKIGDYVLVHVGFALNKIDEKDAEETLRILREMGDIEEENS
jgi:hydrogenase expression/formation protein HypC